VLTYLLICLVILTSIVGCGSSSSDTEISGTVKEVRITSAIKSENNNDDAVGGAIIGGLLFGTTGAIVGAVAGSEESKVVVNEEILGCRLLIQADSQLIAFDYIGSFNETSKIKCSLCRAGDNIKITKTVTRSSKEVETTYWRLCTGGEVITK